MPLLLNRKDVERVLTMKDAIGAVEEGFRQLALGAVTMPQRTVIRVPAHKGLHLAMPAHIGGEGMGSLAVKVVTVFPDNPSLHGLPTTLGTLLLNDPRTGALLAVMDAGYLTAVRTGAASGVATRHLAREDAHSVGIFGAGAMARTQLLAVAEVRPVTSAVVHDPAADLAARFAADMSARLRIPVEPVSDARACAERDIICAASSSRTPVFDGNWLRPGAHVNGVGAHSPDAREIDATTLRRSKLVTDYTPACMAEAGEILLAIRDKEYAEERIHAQIGEVIAGMKQGRSSADEITVFKSVGLAVQDAMTAAKVYDLALSAGVGTKIEVQ
jgi:ornithine cyclodeaminase/alanine dehydrogenase